jgi:FkbM family methyltransferase
MGATAVHSHGFWVPEREVRRFDDCGEFEGLPNLDVRKVANCAALCTSFGTALDVGAYIGIISTYLARKFNRVIAFEAVPDTFDLLRQNIAALTNVTPLKVAVGESAGEVFFTHYPTHGQLSHVIGPNDEPKTVKIGPLPVQAIDSLELPEVSFIKIDVEGHELPVVQGARETILRCRPLVMIEQGGNEEKHFGRPRHEAAAFLEGLGMARHPREPTMNKDRLYTF